MIDIDAIKARHLNPEKNRGRTYYEGHIEVDLAACVAEIERLRADMDAVRAAFGHGADESVWPPGLTVAEAVERLRGERGAGEAAERARIVAFLHNESAWIRNRPALHELRPYDTLTIVAESVESGEYRDTKENP